MSRSSFSVVAAALLIFTSARAQLTFVYTDSTGDHLFGTAANWTPPPEEAAPPSATSGEVTIRSQTGSQKLILPGGSSIFDSLLLDNVDYNGTYLTMTAATTAEVSFTQGIVPTTYRADSGNGAIVTFGQSITVRIDSDQTWSNTYAQVQGSIGGSGRLTFDPYADNYGSLDLSAANHFDGGLSVRDTYLGVHHPDALGGTGSLSFHNVSFNTSVDFTFDRATTLGGTIEFASWYDDGSYSLAGPVVLEGNVSLSNYATEKGPVRLSGGVTETSPASLTIQSGSFVLGDLTGTPTSSYTGNTLVEHGRLFFLNPDAVPASGELITGSNGYLGAAFETGVQSTFVDRVSATAFKGTLGFDTAPEDSTITTIGALDLSAVDPAFAGIGSTTVARIDGPITLGESPDYRFAGGGGTLFIGADLDRSTGNLMFFSNDDPLRLVLQGNNTFGGAVHVSNGHLVLDSANALPETARVHLGSDWVSYFGATENTPLSLAALIGKLDTWGSDSIIGFDTAIPASPRTITAALDLSLNGELDIPYYFGTSSELIVSGAITPSAPDGSLRFAAPGGRLQLDTSLGSGASVSDVYLGTPAANQPGTIALNAANAITGDFHLQSGTLELGHAQALGTSTLVVDENYWASPTLITSADVTLANPIDLHGNLNIGREDLSHQLVLSSHLTGTNYYNRSLTYRGAGNLDLAGTGLALSVYLQAPDTGSLTLSGVYPEAYFSVQSGTLNIGPGHKSIGAISTEMGTTTHLADGATLSLDGSYWSEGGPYGFFTGTLTGTGSLLLASEIHSSLYLYAANTFSGGITAHSGDIEIGHDQALGLGALTVRGDVDLLTAADELTLGNTFDVEGRLRIDEGTYYDTTRLTLNGPIFGTGEIEFRIPTALAGSSLFDGQFTIGETTVEFLADNAGGGATLSFGGYSEYGYQYFSAAATARFLSANPTIGGLHSDRSNTTVELAAGTRLTIDQRSDESYFFGTLDGADASLRKLGNGNLVLGGGVDLGQGVDIDEGAVVFGSPESLAGFGSGSTDPNRIRVGAAGYAGLGTTAVDIATFLGHIDAALTTGALGFDTVGIFDYEYNDYDTIEPNLFNAPIDLSSFATGVALASATEALLGPAAVITPAGGASAPYLFGGSHGILFVQSPLTGERDLVGQSRIDAPLIVAFLGANTFSGNVSVENVGFTFAGQALPAGAILNLGAGGYLGTFAPELSAAAFLNHFPTTTSEGIIGFDRLPSDFEHEDSPRILGEAIGLDRFTGATLPYLGTASQLIVRGPIQLPAADSTLRLAGYRGGELVVESAITGAAVSVQVGDPSSPGTHGDPVFDDTSTVALAGANTYDGGTELFAGRLVVAGSPSQSALGTGPLLVQPNDFVATDPDFQPVLAPYDNAWINNAITLNSSLTIETDEDQLKLAGNIDGAGGLSIADYSTVYLSGHNSYLGGTTLGEATLVTETADALGAGGLELDSHHATLISRSPLELAGSLRFVSPGEASLDVLGSDLTVNGGLELGNGSRSLHLGADLFAHGPITGSASVHLSGGRAWVADARLFTGTINAYDAHLIFTSVSAIPDAVAQFGGLANGYFGLAEVPGNLADEFVAAFDRSSYNTTIGFDTLPGQPTNVFDDLIDLSDFIEFSTSFDDIAIGTASRAIISGTITPPGDAYVFGGNSRGWLEVASNLVDGPDNRSLYLNNEGDRAFVLRLTGDNTYSGGTYISGGGLIIGGTNALPGDTQFTVDGSSYLGTDTSAVSFASLLNHLAIDTQAVTLGLDSTDLNSPRVLSSPDLTRFTSTAPSIALGTATAAVIDGTIALPANQTDYRFAAYGGGQLTVAAGLAGARSVEIGVAEVIETQRDTGLGLPTVALTGVNTYTGGTTWRGGRLTLGNSSALGTSDLNVVGNYSYDFAPHVLRFDTGSITNNINLQGGLKLELESSVSEVALSGTLYGSNTRLAVMDDFTLHLSGANNLVYNTFVIAGGGGVSFENSNLAAGYQSTIVFSDQGGTASFSAPHPEIAALHRDESATAIVQLAAGTTLGISTADNEDFDGTITGDGALDKDGSGRLALWGANTYTGGTTISDGVLHAGNASAFGTGAVVLNGGRLSLAPGVSLANSFSFGDGGGTLGGNGTFNGPVTLGPNSGLAPGESVGALTFTDHLTWTGGAFFEMEIEDAFGGAGSGYDTVNVGGTLTLSATMADPFLIHLLTIDDDDFVATLEFDNTLHYTWTLAKAATIVGFDADAFSFNTSSFNTDLGALGNFFVTSDGTSVFVNFTPVPEPSTYALFGLGLGLIALHAWRRRRPQ